MDNSVIPVQKAIILKHINTLLQTRTEQLEQLEQLELQQNN